MRRIAAGLGADVPVCLASQPARMGGVGELLGLAPLLPACGMVLVNPGAALSTQAVFQARAGEFSPPAMLPSRWEDAAAMARDLRQLGNDLQAPAIQLRPAVATALDWLAAQPGCLLARMSGSGATCFGLFAAADVAGRVADTGPPGWWRWGGALSSS